MNEQFVFTKKLKTLSIILTVLGLVGLGASIFIDSHRALANMLLHSYYLTTLGLAGVFFVALQYITESAWPTVFKRVPEAFGYILPVAAVCVLAVIGFGLHNLYHWSHAELIIEFLPNGEPNPAYDKIIAGKSGYLNATFFICRAVVFFGAWILLSRVLRKLSLKEDQEGGLTSYKKSITYGAIFVAVFAFTFLLAAVDWIMSLDPHWFSTIFHFYNFAGLWVSGIAAITLVVLYLKKQGYLKFVNDSHIHDLGKLMFAFSIFWAYMWISQFLLIWYANLPEESIYYYQRIYSDFNTLFFVNLVINFASPLLILMTRDAKRKRTLLACVAALIIVGHWLDLYLMIMPGTVGPEHSGFGLPEISGMMALVGIFIYMVFNGLTKADLVPKNHPFLDESKHFDI